MYDGPDVILVYDETGSLTTTYLHGPATDHLGSVRDVAVYNSGLTTVVNHIVYDSFGKIESQTDDAYEPVYAFTGREWDADAGLYYYRARWYDANVGRFVSEDFIPDDLQNTYRYVRNSPTNATDPSGLFVDWLFDFFDRQVARDQPQERPAPRPQRQREATDLLDELEQRGNGPLTALDGLELGRRLAQNSIWVGELESALANAAADVGEGVIFALELVPGGGIGGVIARLANGQQVGLGDGAVAIGGDLVGVVKVGKVFKIIPKPAGLNAAASAVASEAAALAKRLIGKTDEACDGARKSARGGRETALSGRSAEEGASQLTDIPLNRGPGRQTLPGTGPGGIRIPDLQVFGPNASLAVRGSLIEVKNVTRLQTSRQLRDMVDAAANLGGHLEIWTNGRIPAKGFIADAREAGQIVIRSLEGKVR